MNNSARSAFADRLALSLLTAWLLIVVVLFVIVNRAGQVQMFFWTGWQDFFPALSRIAADKYLWDLLTAIAGTAVFACACLSAGLAALKHASLQANRLALGLTAFVAGEILFSVLFLALASVDMFSPVSTAIILISGLALGGKTLWRFVKTAPRLSLQFETQNGLARMALGVVLFGLTYSSARLGYDATVEYFSNAKIVASHGGGVLFYPINGFFTSALHSTILFAANIQLFGDQSARLLSWANGVAILLLGLALARESGLSSRAQVYFCVLLLTSTAFVDLLGDGKVELISSAPLLCAAYWMSQSRQNANRNVFLLIGALAGFSVISRPYNVFLVPVFVFFFYLPWIVGNIRLRGVYQGVHLSLPMLWMFPSLLALGAFHLWQNQVWLGSPLAPLTFAQQLDSSDWQWQFDPSLLPWLRWLYPLSVTFLNTPQSLGVVSPLFVGILPFLMRRDVRSRLQISPQLRNLLPPAFLTLALWVALFFTVVEIRYVLVFWVLLFLFAAQAMAAAEEALNKPQRKALVFLSAFLLVFVSLRAVVIAAATYSPIDANGQARCYDSPLCAFFTTVNQTAEPGDRVFVLHAYRYYLRPDLFACSSQKQEYPALQTLAAQKSSAEFWTEIYRQGFRYLTYEKNFAVFHTHFGEIPAPENLPAWLEIRIATETNNQIVFELKANNPPLLQQTTCRLSEDNRWRVIEASAK